MPRPLLLLLGDSLTEFGSDTASDGWISLLLHRFHRSADAAQRGMGGYTTQMFLDVVMAALVVDLAMSLHPQLITLWLGANDAALPDGPSRAQHVSLDQYKANLHAMITQLKTHAPQADILLITPLPVDDDVRRRFAGGGRLDRSNTVMQEYANACTEVGDEAQIQVLDLYTLFTEALPKQQWKTLLSDGLHLSPRGNRVVEHFLVETIKSKFPILEHQLQQWEFPPFDQLLGHNDGECPMPSPGTIATPSLVWQYIFQPMLQRFGTLFRV